MSSPIWTPGALSSEIVSLAVRCWRLVEAQHRVSTLKVVDTLDEQLLLEELIEETKAIVPIECRHLDYLLATPFRYAAAYPRGSRFRRAGRTAGVYYASEEVDAAVAEMAFYRLLFFAESPDTPWPQNAAEYSAFAAEFRSSMAIDLMRTPLDRDRAVWTDLVDYSRCQELADSARQAAIDVIRYQSVRDPRRGANLALLSCRVFSRPQPVERRTWRIRLNAVGAQAICEHPEQRIAFSREAFAEDPRLAAMRWQRD
jgi:hypothetical protein